MSNVYINSLLQRYLKALGVYISKSEISSIHNSDPYATSAFSIIQTLRYFNINAVAYKTDLTSLQAQKVSPVILHCVIKEGVFVLLKKISKDFVRVYDYHENRNIKLSIEQFLKIWDGIAISGTPKVSIKKLTFLQLPNIVLFTTTIAFFSYYLITNSQLAIVLLFNLLGVFLSVNALIVEQGTSNNFIDRYCNTSKEKSCSTVITSEVAFLGLNINLSVLGLLYFLFNICYLILFGSTSNYFSFVLTCIGVAGLPFIIIAFYYQFIRLRTICTICLSITAVYLASNIFTAIYVKNNLLNFSHFAPVVLLYLFISAGLAFLLAKSIQHFIEHREKYWVNKLNEQTLKRSPQLREVAFSMEENIALENISISAGNSNSKFLITSILSLHCKHCKNVVLQLLNLINRFPGIIKWDIVLFTGYKQDAFEETLEILSMCQTWPDKKIEIIESWYSNKNISKLQKKYPTEKEASSLVKQLQNSDDEIKQKGIAKVPVTIFKGKEYSRFYDLQQDLELLLIELTEE